MRRIGQAFMCLEVRCPLVAVACKAFDPFESPLAFELRAGRPDFPIVGPEQVFGRIRLQGQQATDVISIHRSRGAQMRAEVLLPHHFMASNCLRAKSPVPHPFGEVIELERVWRAKRRPIQVLEGLPPGGRHDDRRSRRHVGEGSVDVVTHAKRDVHGAVQRDVVVDIDGTGLRRSIDGEPAVQ
jgi:hypothetical protein